MYQIDFRKKILRIAKRANSRHCHIGSCLSCIDILTQTFLHEMRQNDKFILSKGHASLALFVILQHLKKISDKDLETYLQNDTYFGIHTPSSFPEIIPLPTGSLGHGLSFAAGLAYGYRLKKNTPTQNVYCLLSDGECNEGAVWEAALFASKHKLDNLIALIDKNNIQAFGKTEEVLGDAASKEKWHAFGFSVFECNGHSLKDLKQTFNKIKRLKKQQPRVIICKTKRAKGISSIEDEVKSNYVAVDDKLFHELNVEKETYEK